jgi:vacuolar protein sorting-associated protein 13A/C
MFLMTEHSYGNTPPLQAPVEEEVFENERYIPIRGWSSRNLTPLDRRRFSYGRDQAINDSTTAFPRVPLPNGEHKPCIL